MPVDSALGCEAAEARVVVRLLPHYMVVAHLFVLAVAFLSFAKPVWSSAIVSSQLGFPVDRFGWYMLLLFHWY